MELDSNHDGKITHEEFVLILKYIEQKQAQLPPLNQTSISASNSKVQKSPEGGTDDEGEVKERSSKKGLSG